MIRVLIAEDSAVTREYLRWLIDDAEGLEVAGVANDGAQAVELAERLKPDVILMDVHMPQMDGFQATRLIMERHPTPIVMATASSSKAETRGAFEALDAGALLLLDKPPAPWDPGHDEAAGELLRAVKLMAEVKVVRRWAPRPRPQEPPRFPRVRDPRVIAIGASTGGPQVLSAILAALPGALSVPLLLVQHISEGFIEGFVDWLGTRTPMEVVLAERGDELRPGVIHVAGSDHHMGIEGDRRIVFDAGPPVNGFRPSISHLFGSIARCCGRESVGILLTGMGRDGADGLRRMRDAGALTIAQDEASSVIFGMPGEAVRLNAAVEVLAPEQIAEQLWALELERVQWDILIVEDSRTQAAQLEHLLEKAGHPVRVARDGVAALEMARERPPALVLTDVVMPRMDGYTLCRTLKADRELGRTPVILLTSLSSPQDVIEGLACGADNFVRKPYDGASLLARVERALADVRERGRVPVLAGRHEIAAEREQVIDFLFSTFEETVHLDGELTRSYHSLDLLYRLTEGLNRAASERDVIMEALARAMELSAVRGAWIEIADGRIAGTTIDLSNAEADLGVELRAGQHVLGILQLVGPDEELLSDEELRTLEAFGNQAGAALERALLHEHLERRVQERTAELTAEVAARRRAEEALRAMAAIVESADDGMVRLGPDGRIETWNRGAARLYGYIGDEAVGNSIELVVAPDEVEGMRDMISRVAWGESIQGFETNRLTRDGKRIEVSLTLSPVRDADGAVVAVAEIARDITARKELERALLQAQKLESVGRLAGGIAHDFNNLMTAVIGFGELALLRLDEDDPVHGYVDEAKRAGERATELTQRLLAFGRRQTLRPRPLDLNEVVGEMRTLLGRLIGAQFGLRFELDDAPCPLVADRSQLEQVVMNLAINARDAMETGGRLTIATEARADTVRLIVSDTGSGMDAETKAQIFEPFFTTKEEGKGTGLGLSTVFGIVHQSGGRIAVHSELRRGTTFTIDLPRGAVAPVDGDGGGAEATPGGGSGSILVVEDDEAIRALVRGVLVASGYDVRVAADAQEALDGPDADLLVTDILMPGMNGRELATHIVERAPGTRVIFISGYTGDDAQLEAGARFLAKPFTPSELLKQVQALMTA